MGLNGSSTFSASMNSCAFRARSCAFSASNATARFSAPSLLCSSSFLAASLAESTA